jgi:hypothetical protein
MPSEYADDSDGDRLEWGVLTQQWRLASISGSSVWNLVADKTIAHIGS